MNRSLYTDEQTGTSSEVEMSEIRPRLCSVTQAQQYLGGIGRVTLYRLISTGALTPIKVGGRTMFEIAALDAYIDQQREAIG